MGAGSGEAGPGEWVRRLAVPEADDVPPVCFPETIAAALGQIGPGAVAWAARTSRDLALRHRSGLVGLTESPHDVELLRLATEPAVVEVLRGLAAGRVEPSPLAPEIRVVLREYVRRNVSLETTSASVLAGHGWLSEQLIAACRALVEPEELVPQLELISKVLFGYLNPLSAGVQEVYAQEQLLWSRSADRSKDLLVRAVLAGERTDAQAVSDALHYSIEHRSHVGVVLWRDGVLAHEQHGPRDLLDLAAELLGELGATSRLELPVGGLAVWAWGSRPGGFDAPARGRAVAARMDSSGARAAVGNPGVGLDGLRRTHGQARAAARTARLLGERSGRVTPFDDVNLLSLLSADAAQAREFVLDELAGLAGDDQASQDLRETVLTYLECHHSPQTAARSLFVARNTVTYRVKRAEALLGHGVGERESELRAALLLARIVLQPHEEGP